MGQALRSGKVCERCRIRTLHQANTYLVLGDLLILYIMCLNCHAYTVEMFTTSEEDSDEKYSQG